MDFPIAFPNGFSWTEMLVLFILAGAFFLVGFYVGRYPHDDEE